MSTSSHRALLALLAVALVSNGLGCGGSSSTGRPSTDSTAASHPISAGKTGTHYLNDGDHEPINDEDQDNNTADTDNDYREDHLKTENNSYHDEDDSYIVNYGHPANPADRQAITTLVRRYYAAAVADDGAAACSMLTPTFVKAIPGDYGRYPGPPYLRGKTCATVMTKMMRHSQAQASNDFAVTAVRSHENVAYALIGSTVLPASFLQLERVGGSWRVSSLLGSALP